MMPPIKKHTTDIAIIGAGPAGLFAVFECGMLKMKCHVLDSLERAGGQCRALYPEKPIYDIPGYPVITGGALIDSLEKQAAPFQPVYHLNQQVVELIGAAGAYEITTSSGVTVSCKAVIVAGGAGAFGPNRPPLENLSAFEGKSVFYMVGSRADFICKKVAIAGGGDSAVDWALSLSDVAEKIYFIHRRDKFRAAPESVERLLALAKTGKVEMIVPYQLHALHGENGVLESVEVSDLDGKTKHLEADTLLPFFGLAAQLGPIAGWGFGVDQHRIPVDPATMETGRKGIFAIGDIAHYAGKLKLILTGFSEAAVAAHAIHPLVFPNQALHFEYSTTKGVP